MKKSILPIIVLTVMALAFTALAGCSRQERSSSGLVVTTEAPVEKNTALPSEAPLPDGYARITFTIDARDAYKSGKLPESVKTKLEKTEGLILNSAKLSIRKELKLEGAFRTIKALIGGEFEVNDGSLDSITGISNGCCGENSRWILKRAGEAVDGHIASVELNDGDAFELIFSLDGK